LTVIPLNIQQISPGYLRHIETPVNILAQLHHAHLNVTPRASQLDLGQADDFAGARTIHDELTLLIDFSLGHAAPAHFDLAQIRLLASFGDERRVGQLVVVPRQMDLVLALVQR